METETEKTSYTLNHDGDEKDESKTESYEPLVEEDQPATEMDKMLEPVTEKAKSIEILAEPNETTKLEDTKEAVKEENQSSAIAPTKNRFLRFFERKNPPPPIPNESQNGNGVNAEVDGGAAAPKKKLLAINLKNPFAKKTDTAVVTPTPTPDKPIEASSSDDKKPADTSEDKKTDTKFKPSISFPKFSGIINKFRKAPRNEDIEMGKAGLASMETLDDSTKDPWNQEEGAADTVDADKPKDDEKAAEETEEKKSVLAAITSYNCSIDDIALIAGIIVFLILVSLILAFTFLGNSKETRIAPVRDGKVLAVTGCGLVEGLVEDSAVAFRGIPYGIPPVGERRFEYSRFIDEIEYCWNGTFQAYNNTPAECLQLVNGEPQGSEDCLTLDIVTPEVRYINLLPVVVMIGSNDFNGGSPGILRPSARYSRSKDVIYVRPRFRLSTFGFLALEALSNSSNVPASGNYALSDIIAALEWLQTNIVNFGGDPNSVTLFGHRAGATLVTALTSSSKASKLFARAWASSPSAHYPGKPLVENERENIDYVKNFPECENLDKSCWKGIDNKTLLAKLPESWTKDVKSSLPTVDEKESRPHEFLVLDGIYLTKHIQDAWKTKNVNSKLIIGTTKHVIYDKTKPLPFNTNLTAEEVRKYVEDSKVGQANLTDQALEKYGETVQGLISMISDIRVVCPLLVLARSQDNLPFYIVSQTQGDLNVADVDSDVQAILGRYQSETPEKRRYFDAIRQLFYYFVQHGKLNHYSSQHFILNIEQDVIPSSEHANCDFWISNNFVPHYSAV